MNNPNSAHKPEESTPGRTQRSEIATTPINHPDDEWEDTPEQIDQADTPSSITDTGIATPEGLLDEEEELSSGQIHIEINGEFTEQIAAEISTRIKEAIPSAPEVQIGLAIQHLIARIQGRSINYEDSEDDTDDEGKAEALWASGTQLVETFRQHGGIDKLEEAILLLKQSLNLCTAGSQNYNAVLTNLAGALHTYYQESGDINALTEAIGLFRQLLESIHPKNHPNTGRLFNNLASLLTVQYEHSGDSSTLEEAIRLSRQALELRPRGHSDRISSLNSLATSLMIRYDNFGNVGAVEEATYLLEEAILLLPSGHPDRSGFLNNLAKALGTQYEHSGDRNALEKAVRLFREALELRSHQHPLRSSSLNNLANTLLKQHAYSNDENTLEELIRLFHEALELRSHSHPNRGNSLDRLANCYLAYFEQTHDEVHLATALKLWEESLDTWFVGHPQRHLSYHGIARVYLQDSSLFDWFKALNYIKQATEDNSPLPRNKLEPSIASLRMLEYAAVRENPQKFLTFQPALDVYTAVIQLLPHVTHAGLDLSSRLSELSNSEELCRTAAIRAVLLEQLPLAIELYEEGKAIFWSQALRLRSAELDDLPANDRDELLRLFQLLEQDSDGFSGDAMDKAATENWIACRRQLSEQADTVVEQIRQRPGFDRFLKVPPFDKLAEAASHGFIIALLAYGPVFSAIIIHPSRSCQFIPLTSVKEDMLRKLNIQLSGENIRNMNHGLDPLDLDKERGIGISKKIRSPTPLELIWRTIVEPIILGIGLKKATDRQRPRVHWYPSGEFARLPLHAAGIYGGKDQVCAADFIVSSYTPSLSALIRSRENFVNLPRHELHCLISGECAAVGLDFIPQVVEEIKAVAGIMSSASSTILNDFHASPAVDEILEQVPATNILHLACHGSQDADPLKSCFMLSDGPLTISALMRLNLPNAMLAFLSACETGKGDDKQPDQAVHLAASMLFCGFRSVVGAMWSMHDMDGPAVAQWFYEALLKNETIKLDDIPYALDEAIRKLQNTGVSPARWATYMHLGA